MDDFVAKLKLLLFMEHNMTEQQATELVNSKPDIVMQGIFKNALRATALALQMHPSDTSTESK